MLQHVGEIMNCRHTQPGGNGIEDAVETFVEFRIVEDNDADSDIDDGHCHHAHDQDPTEEF